MSSDELAQVTLSKQLKVLESSRSTGKGGPDFQWSVVSGHQKELTGYGSEPGVIAQSCSQTKDIRDPVTVVSATGEK